ncbi:TetR-like C-terminal domain-containing protein [Sorangium sp. So ce861]|uniref:TetR-like C-terminal domain-containing protein n=1 Tax=Sorangium sp. So ce861 TaxID=3133323 RepID=UPI003F60A27C
MGVTDADEPVERVFQALCEGRLARDELTARKIAAFLGQTTMVLYHHFGSLDGFLIRVDGAGWRRLAGLLEARARAGGDARSLAVAYVEFALRHPDLYWLMAERRFDRARLREEGRLRLARPLWGGFVELLRRYGSARPSEDTHVLFAGLHGIAMLALSGRANLGEAPAPDEEVAFAAARRLADLVLPARPPEPPLPPAIGDRDPRRSA